MDIRAIVPCLIIRLISPWFIIRIERIPAGNFGDFVWQTGLYYCKKKLNINRICNLGWAPKINFDYGLKKTIESYIEENI